MSSWISDRLRYALCCGSQIHGYYSTSGPHAHYAESLVYKLVVAREFGDLSHGLLCRVSQPYESFGAAILINLRNLMYYYIMSSNQIIETEEVVVEDVEALLTAAEADFKTVAASLDAAIKGLKALGKRVKKEGREDVLVSKGTGKGKRLADVLDLAVTDAKTKGKSFGSAVLEQLTE